MFGKILASIRSHVRQAGDNAVVIRHLLDREWSLIFDETFGSGTTELLDLAGGDLFLGRMHVFCKNTHATDICAFQIRFDPDSGTDRRYFYTEVPAGGVYTETIYFMEHEAILEAGDIEAVVVGGTGSGVAILYGFDDT